MMLRVVFTVIITHNSPHPHKYSCVTTLGHSTGKRNENVLVLCFAAKFKSFEIFLNHLVFQLMVCFLAYMLKK